MSTRTRSKAARSPVDPDSGPLSIGRQIRDLRKAKGLSTAALANAIERSTGYVNNVEHDRTDVSVSALARIGDALGVHISWFFQAVNTPSPQEAGFVVRHGNRRQLQLSDNGISEELLSPDLSGKSMLLISTFPPSAITGNRPTRTDAEMAGVVLSGTLDVRINEKEFHLEEGDSIYIPKGANRKSENRSSTDSITLWVVTPPVY